MVRYQQSHQRYFDKSGDNPGALIWSLAHILRKALGEPIAKPELGGVCINGISDQENNPRQSSTFAFLIRRLEDNVSSVKWNMAFA
jgi:hypothetical protein